MIKNETLRIWVNRIFAFLAGGLLLFIILQMTTVNQTTELNKQLTKELDEIKYASGRLLDQGKMYFEKNDYSNAKKILNTLFEKHPMATETAEAKTLFAAIETRQNAMDKRWDAVLPGIREEWKKTKSIQLEEQFAEQFKTEKEKWERDLATNLELEWNRVKDQLRREWEKQI